MLPDALLYPYFDYYLGQAFKQETQLFFDSLVREGSEHARVADRRLLVRPTSGSRATTALPT